MLEGLGWARNRRRSAVKPEEIGQEEDANTLDEAERNKEVQEHG